MDAAAHLETSGVSGYAIDADGFFRSNMCYPPKIMEIPGTRLPLAGDTLLRVWAEKSTFSLVWPDASGALSSIYQHVRDADMFGRGLPLYGQCQPPDITRDDSTSKLWAIYESYGPVARATLSSYGTAEKGVSVVHSTLGFLNVTGRDAYGTSTNTLTPRHEPVTGNPWAEMPWVQFAALRPPGLP